MLPGRSLFALMVWGLYSVPAHTETIQVTIDQLVFSPMQIKTKVGDTVEWINKDILAHSATVNGDWDVMIAANGSASLVLKKAGTIAYYCRFHPNMKGQIIVTREQAARDARRSLRPLQPSASRPASP